MIKKALLFITFLTILSCSNNENLQNCIQSLPLSITADLNNPELISALVPGGFVELNNRGEKGILLINVNGNEFVAYDKRCPASDCNQPMTFERGIVLKCQCDNSEYGVGFGIGGQPQTNGFVCPAIEYRVIKNGTVLRITNF
ncbi:Rieske (2Fe-2S) protein [Polaribacter septentrionalilitoris]|uniref:phosphoribosylaminoimidazole carboxylase n=1 Tax=Polaribacter septentrionalilitoris TaxID=2494657 RepID=UPI00135A11B4|nr:phosphoribosylaminoimidazole carboxylase [Polaribacter septentrionalilitoris]